MKQTTSVEAGRRQRLINTAADRGEWWIDPAGGEDTQRTGAVDVVEDAQRVLQRIHRRASVGGVRAARVGSFVGGAEQVERRFVGSRRGARGGKGR